MVAFWLMVVVAVDMFVVMVVALPPYYSTEPMKYALRIIF